MATLRIEGLPEGALEAAAVFHAMLPPLQGRGPTQWGKGSSEYSDSGFRGHEYSREPLHQLRWSPSPEGEDLVLIFPPADHTHRGWRLAAVQSLSREYAPWRVNALASDDEAAITAALAYLETAPGLTGQYLPLDGAGAGDVIPSAQ